MTTQPVSNGRHTVQGTIIQLPHAKFITIYGSRGYLMCGYLNIDKAEQLKDCAAIIPGVNSFEDMLAKPISAITSQAAAAGIKIGMTGQEAIDFIY